MRPKVNNVDLKVQRRGDSQLKSFAISHLYKSLAIELDFRLGGDFDPINLNTYSILLVSQGASPKNGRKKHKDICHQERGGAEGSRLPLSFV